MRARVISGRDPFACSRNANAPPVSQMGLAAEASSPAPISVLPPAAGLRPAPIAPAGSGSVPKRTDPAGAPAAKADVKLSRFKHVNLIIL